MKSTPLTQPRRVMMEDKIIQVSGFGVNNTKDTQCDYVIVALSERGKVLITSGDGIW